MLIEFGVLSVVDKYPRSIKLINWSSINVDRIWSSISVDKYPTYSVDRIWGSIRVDSIQDIFS